LGLPNRTPNWFLRLEANVHPMEAYITRVSLNFWGRIVTAKPDSLVKNCYLSLKQSRDKSNCKSNWYNSLTTLLAKWGVEDILNHEPADDDVYEISTYFSEIAMNVKEVFDKSVKMDIISMKNSQSMPHYRNIRTHCNRERFLNYRVNWNVIKVMVQLTSNLSHFSISNKVVKLGELCNFYNSNELSTCRLCTRNEIENMQHVMFKCPFYDSIRKKFLSKYTSSSLPYQAYLEFFVELSVDKAKDILAYTKAMISFRDINLGEEHNLDVINYDIIQL
jgi:hypothetical protein